MLHEPSRTASFRLSVSAHNVGPKIVLRTTHPIYRAFYVFVSHQALGNHEFDDGVENLVSFLKEINVSVVMSNVNVSLEPRWPKSPPLFTKYKVFNVGGEKVGVVGYVLESTPK